MLSVFPEYRLSSVNGISILDGRTDVFSIPLTGEKSIALFLDALKFALFDISSEKLGKNPEVRPGLLHRRGTI